MKSIIKSMIWNKLQGSKKQPCRKTRRKRIKKKNEVSVSSPWEKFKITNICIIGVPEGEEKEQEIQNVFEEIMKENIPNLMKEIDVQVQEAQSPKQDGCKEAHSKTGHNKNARGLG